jgi:hypothetical protein
LISFFCQLDDRSKRDINLVVSLAAIFSKPDNQKTIPSGFLTSIRLKPELNISVHYVAAYLRHIENDIIIKSSKTEDTNDKKPKIKLKLSDIYNIRISLVSAKIQKDIDGLATKATSLLKESLQKTQRDRRNNKEILKIKDFYSG